MMNVMTKMGVLTAMLLGLPLLGVSLAGLPTARYFEFPPTTRYVQHAGFTWWVFALIALFTAAWVVPLVRHGWRVWRTVTVPAPSPRHAFPWWGWAGLVGGAVAWLLAWTRLPWMAPVQGHTFTPLWVAYILVINALTFRRTGSCMMVARPRFFLLLFPVSASFWWFFEYLNRFVQNWYYMGLQLTPWTYFLAATLPFSTVLPAVLGTQEWLLSFPRLRGAFVDFRAVQPSRPRLLGGAVLMAAGVGLAGIGVWPDALFPLVWVSPVLIMVALQGLMGERHVLSGVARGDWQLVVTAALASLLCGFFWEMWNEFSMNRWLYNVPYVQRFLVFEMPLLGFAGYLPFGLECAAVGGTVASLEALGPDEDGQLAGGGATELA